MNKREEEEEEKNCWFTGRPISSLSTLALFTQLIEYNGGICWISSLFSRDLVRTKKNGRKKKLTEGAAGVLTAK